MPKRKSEKAFSKVWNKYVLDKKVTSMFDILHFYKSKLLQAKHHKICYSSGELKCNIKRCERKIKLGYI